MFCLLQTREDYISVRPVYCGREIYSCKRLSEFESYFYQMDKHLSSIGVNISTFQVETANGQFELVLAPTYGIQSADNEFLLKQCLQESTPAYRADWRAVFMTAPFDDTSFNGLHFSHSLWKSSSDSEDVFRDSNDPDGLSEVARSWLAGLVRHAAALTAFCCPTVNCYRRFGTFLGTPSVSNWGFDDRKVTFRVKTGHELSQTYIESRIPSSAANPYLVMAGTLAAGMDGLKNNLDLANEDANKEIPRSLSEALESLENDEVLKEALGEQFVRWFVEMKRTDDLKILEMTESNNNLIGDHLLKKNWSQQLLKMERDFYLDYI